MGLGFNGAQLLALGGCFCKDLRYAAPELGVALGGSWSRSRSSWKGTLLLTRAAAISVQCKMQDGSDTAAVIEKAKAICMVANSLSRGFPVVIAQAGQS